MSKRLSTGQSRHFTLIEVSEQVGIEEKGVIELIQREWICPVSETTLDEEDLARIRLIQDLREQFGANDDAIPLILHLMDQLYYLRHQISRFRNEKE